MKEGSRMVASYYVLSEQTVNYQNGTTEIVSSAFNLTGKHHHKVIRYFNKNPEAGLRNYTVHVVTATHDQDTKRINSHQLISEESLSSAQINRNLSTLVSVTGKKQIQHERMFENRHLFIPYLDTSLGGVRMTEERRGEASNSPDKTINKDNLKTGNRDNIFEESQKPLPERSVGIDMTSSMTKLSKSIYRHVHSVMSFDDGDLDLEPRIVGGEDASIIDFPFMASLRRDWCCHHCGAVLVSSSWLLTAGHCLLTPTPEGLILSKPEGWFVIAGVSNIADNRTERCNKGMVRRDVVEMLHHPQFFLFRLLWDLGMVRVEPEFSLRSEIMPARLPSEQMTPEVDFATGTACIVTGWGQTAPVEEHEFVERRFDRKSWSECNVEGRSFLLPHLQKVELPLLNWEECAAMYPNWKGIKEDATLCTFSDEGKDACHGDSGGPLICSGVTVGIVSWGGGQCGTEKKPGVYARIDPYVGWIQRTLLSERKMGSGEAHRPPAVVKLVTAVLMVSVTHL